jgi:hypothetical protein
MEKRNPPPKPILWRVTCTNPEWSVSHHPHAQCVAYLSSLFEDLAKKQSDPEIKNDIYHKGVFKVRALKAEQDAHITIIIPGQPKPVIWVLTRA